MKFDGATVKSTSLNCVAGGCEASFSQSMNMALYEGGVHTAEVIAIDGAGNTTSKQWAINIDPSGVVPRGEATNTLEAVEKTTESQPVAPTSEVIDPGAIEEGNNPSLTVSGSQLKSAGTAASSVVEVEPKGGFSVEAEKEPLRFSLAPLAARVLRLPLQGGRPASPRTPEPEWTPS